MKARTTSCRVFDGIVQVGVLLGAGRRAGSLACWFVHRTHSLSFSVFYFLVTLAVVLCFDLSLSLTHCPCQCLCLPSTLSSCPPIPSPLPPLSASPALPCSPFFFYFHSPTHPLLTSSLPLLPSSLSQVAMTKFGDFAPLCHDTPSYPWCNLFYRQLQHHASNILTGVSSNSQSAPVGVNPNCGIPRVGNNGSLANIANIIACGLSIFVVGALIVFTSKRKAAVGTSYLHPYSALSSF